MAIRLRYPEIAPEGYAALTAFGHYINTATALSPTLIGFVNLRASQLNGCNFCINMHSAELRKLHEPQTRIDAIADWRTSDAFTPRERAALAWTDSLTLLQNGSHASEEDFAAVREFFDDKDLVDLTLTISAINAWNRLGVAFRPSWNKGKAQAKSEEASPQTPAVIDDDGGKVAEDA